MRTHMQANCVGLDIFTKSLILIGVALIPSINHITGIPVAQIPLCLRIIWTSFKNSDFLIPLQGFWFGGWQCGLGIENLFFFFNSHGPIVVYCISWRTIELNCVLILFTMLWLPVAIVVFTKLPLAFAWIAHLLPSVEKPCWVSRLVRS